MKRYSIYNQLTGRDEYAPTYAKAQRLRDKLVKEYMDTLTYKIYLISVLTQKEDGTWDKKLSDDYGEPTDINFAFPIVPVPNPTKVEVLP